MGYKMKYLLPHILDCIPDTHEVCLRAPIYEPPQEAEQSSQPMCVATTQHTETIVSTTEVTETLCTTMAVAPVLPESHHVPVTVTHIVHSNTSCSNGASKTSIPITPGAAVAIVLGVVLIIQTMACTVAWVVCFKRRKGKMEREGTGRLCEQVYDLCK